MPDSADYWLALAIVISGGVAGCAFAAIPPERASRGWLLPRLALFAGCFLLCYFATR